MTQDTNKHKGFLFSRKAKDSDKKFLTGNLTLAKDMKAGDKIELVAHLSNKVTKDGDPYFFMFERDEYTPEASAPAKKSVAMKKAEDSAPF